MSKEKPAAPEGGAPAKKGGAMKMILLAVAMLALGGGGAFGLVKAGVIGEQPKKDKEDNAPKLLKKGEEDPFAPKAEAGKEGEAGAAEIAGEGGSPYRTAYYNFTEDFTSNMRNSGALIQISVACSTHRDGRVLMWVKKHELAIRSAMLAVLADTPEEEVIHIEGKDRLQKRLAGSINKVLIETEGFGGIDNVYFKSFLVQ